MSLSSRIVTINGAVFAGGTMLLAFSPATVSARPVVRELVVLCVGLAVMVLANALLVRHTVRPLEELVRDLDDVRAGSGRTRVDPVPGPHIAGRLATAVNDLLDRMERGEQAAALATLAGQEAERSRVAQELHDGVGQSLTALLLELGHLADRADESERGRLAAARETARRSLEEVRAVARQLRPHVLEDLGLRSALAALTTELFGHGGVRVERGIAPGLPVMDDATELVVFRVAQEALTNVARHAGASVVSVTLGRLGDAVQLEVADDGVGLSPMADGTGLQGMRERAALVGGRLDLRRRDGGGTVVRLVVPVAT